LENNQRITEDVGLHITLK